MFMYFYANKKYIIRVGPKNKIMVTISEWVSSTFFTRKPYHQDIDIFYQSNLHIWPSALHAE